MPSVPPLTVVSPLPPARNGIADYAALLIRALHGRHFACAAAVEAWDTTPPPAPGVPVLDQALAHRRDALVLHQMGNNAQHGFVLRALRRMPGVTTLHDPGLLHLHEVAGEPTGTILAAMAAAPAPLGPLLARQRRDRGLALQAEHALCDCTGEVLGRSRAVIVHSRFAAARLRAMHGAERTDHVVVVPHPVPETPMPDRAAARAALGIAPDDFLVVTAGFATRAKRFDWILAALEQARRAGTTLLWIHAGEERPGELDLSGSLAQAAPALRARVTGWLDDPALDAHIAAADVLVNLRFPSHGESSGPLARALAAGTCAIVSDTAGYAELPRDAVLHLPVVGAAPALAAALTALAAAPDLARRIGEAGRRFALRDLAPDRVAAAHAAILLASRDRPVHRPGAAPPLLTAAMEAGVVRRVMQGVTGRCRLFLGGDAAGPVPDLLPPEASVLGLRVMAAPAAPGLLLDLALPDWRA